MARAQARSLWQNPCGLSTGGMRPLNTVSEPAFGVIFLAFGLEIRDFGVF